MRSDRLSGIFLLLITCFALLGCDSGSGGGASGQNVEQATWTGDGAYEVVATTGMVADIARNVAGKHGKVKGLMGPGVDPHLYKPTRGDIANVIDADIVFYSGLMLEGRMGDLLLKAARQGKPVYPVTEAIDEQWLLEPDEFQGHWDPHVWMDAEAWSKTVDVVADGLAKFDPANADDYAANAETYKAKLAELDAYVTKVIASIPQEQRVMVTAHDAFNYFGRAYNIDVRGVQGLSTESEAGVDDINRLVDFLVEHKIGAIFVESSVADKNMRALIEGASKKGHAVVIGGTLFSDAMGKGGTYEGTYVGMIDHNATIIARSLGGEAPEKGMQGKLTGVKH